MAEDKQANQGGGGPAAGGGSDMGARLESTRTHARQAAQELKTAATEMADQYRGKAEEAWDQAQARARTLQEDGEQYVRENPTQAVFTALGIGFILGIIFRR